MAKREGTAWFGQPWPSAQLRSPICEDDRLQVPTPVGTDCLYCGETIVEGDRGVLMPAVLDLITGPQIQAAHIECQLRCVVGGPAHLRGICTCHGGNTDPDEGMSYRQSALAVWEWLSQHGQLRK